MAETDRLALLFLSEISFRGGEAPKRETESQSETKLELDLADACARGRAVAGDITLDDQTFVRALAGTVARNKGNAADVSRLAIEDLYLAFACLLQAPRAVEVFNRLHRVTIRRSIARVVRSADDIAEIEQQLLVDLLIGATGSVPLISTYGGQAPLDRWLGVVAHRTTLTWLRRRRSEGRAREGAALQPLLAGEANPEVRFLKERYQHEFSQALKAALGGLNERYQLILRWHFVDGVTVQRIGKMFDVTQPTASRWLAAAREALLTDVKAKLRELIGKSTAEIASLAGLVASRLDLTLSTVLRAGPMTE